MEDREQEGPADIALVGDLTESESDVADRLLGVEPGGQCTLYFDCPGGSPYSAVALTSIILLRKLDVTGVVAGECSSGRRLAICRLHSTGCDEIQRALVSPDEMAK